MIKKLRKKFILLALAVVAAVIVVIVAGIDVANYIRPRLCQAASPTTSTRHRVS